MNDDQIRKLLSGIPPQPFWAPKGEVAILEEKVIEAGGDPQEVLTWVEARGGRLDRDLPAVHRSVISRHPQPDSRRYYSVPESALAAGEAAA